MAILWMALKKCTMDTLGAQQKQPISRTILDSHSNVLIVLVISSAQTTIVITCIAMKGFVTTVNGRDQVLSHFMWKM